MRTTTTRRKTFRHKYKYSRKARKHTRKSRNLRGSRHLRGGQNIGANCSEPNYSIYNTNFLKLFPYKA